MRFPAQTLPYLVQRFLTEEGVRQDLEPYRLWLQARKQVQLQWLLGLQVSEIGVGRGVKRRQAVMQSDRASIQPGSSMIVAAEVGGNQAA